MNPEITFLRAAAWAPSSSELAESSSELEALVSVILVTFWMALLTSPEASDCSRVAWAILVMLAAVSSTPWTILASDSPAFSESWAPSGLPAVQRHEFLSRLAKTASLEGRTVLAHAAQAALAR